MANFKYVPTLWAGGKTIATADIMNNMENGIVMAHQKIDDIKYGGWKRQILTPQTYQLLDVEDGVVYQVNEGSDVAINGIVSGKPDGTHFYLLLASSTTGSITINSGDGIIVPGGTYVINVSNGNNEVLIEFIKVNGSTFRLRK